MRTSSAREQSSGGGARPEAVLGGVLSARVDQVAVATLRCAYSPRHRLSEEHVAALAQLDGPFPPIAVRAGTGEVVDGQHRLEAAVRRGDQFIAVRHFSGTSDDAYVYATRVNVAHGLPLSAHERRSAALRILAVRPQWSDRRVAEAAGLSAGAVGRLRSGAGPQDATSTVRTGRDDRARPVDPRRGRERAARLLTEQPDASLRTIAAQAGVSPGTVRDVRARLGRGEDPVPEYRRGGRRTESRPPTARLSLAAAPRTVPANPGGDEEFAAAFRSLRQDPSLRLTEIGRFLIRTLEPRGLFVAEQRRLLHGIPGHCTPTLAVAVRAYADALSEFADRLDDRQHRSALPAATSEAS